MRMCFDVLLHIREGRDAQLSLLGREGVADERRGEVDDISGGGILKMLKKLKLKVCT